MPILHAADFAVQPWKNGGGETTEIAVFPPAAGFEAIDWRVSMAKVAAPGPFSLFPGIDRTLGLIEGAGLVLDLAARGEVSMRPGAAPLSFPGDVPVAARLIDGPILDLNVMTRRGRWRHHLSRVHVSRAAEIDRRGDACLVLFAGSGGNVGGERFARGDALLVTTDEAVVTCLALDMPGEIWIADLWRLSAGS